MKSARVLPLLFLSWTLAVAACATPESIDEDAGGTGGASTGGSNGAKGGNNGTGGSTATGGSPGTGGGIATGGTPGTGGAKATGGATGTGGNSATGGTTGTGGAKATGGTTGTGGGSATGGTTGTGGTPATGGTTGTGGMKATGGTTGTGGTKATGGTTGTGGTPATGGTTGTGGTPGTGGTTGTGGTGSNAVCKFASGLNVAWVNFASDIPNPNLMTFKTIFTNSAAVGGRVIRWWFHTNGTVTPGYGSDGKAMALTTGAINDVVALANTAHTAGVALNISLWSFDMLQGGENISTTLRTNNQNLLTVDDNRNAYVSKVLVPLVTALKGNPGVYSYEIFNEPEGMTMQHGWTGAQGGTEIDQKYIQKTVNVFAAAIHSTGSQRAGDQRRPDLRDLRERGQRHDQPLLEQCPHCRGRYGQRDARLLRGSLLRVEQSDGEDDVLLLRQPGVALGAGQERRDGRVLGRHYRRRERLRPVHLALQQRLQRGLGLELRDQRRQRRQPDDRLADDEDADAEPLHGSDGDAERLPLTA